MGFDLDLDSICFDNQLQIVSLKMLENLEMLKISIFIFLGKKLFFDIFCLHCIFVHRFLNFLSLALLLVTLSVYRVNLV